MATVFVSYVVEDQQILSSLVPLLKEKGHKVVSDQELFIGATWRDQLMGALLDSDVVLLIWSEKTPRSQFVAAEVGAARASGHIGLLPVLVGDVAIPAFIQDLMVQWIHDTNADTLTELSKKLDDSIKKYLEFRDQPKKGRPKVFISHRHKDEAVVRSLTECITAYFQIDAADIRCTSVSPYRLRVGERTSDRLRDEIADAEVVLGVLTTDTLESSYVAFELGAAWGRGVWTCPLLALGADQGNIPDPIRDLSPLFLSIKDDCLQLLNDMESTSLERRKKIDRGDLDNKIEQLVKTASSGTKGRKVSRAVKGK